MNHAERLKPILGPALLGAGVWAAAGMLTVEGTDSAVRLASPASAWWLLGGAAGFLLPALGRRPSLALPAILPVIGWLPIALPPIMLVWTGRLAWVPVGLVLLTSLIESMGRRRRPAVGSGPRSHVALAGGLTLVILVASAWSVAPRLPSGDEPHYLMISSSLLNDGDLRIENNHAQGDLVPYLAVDARPHYIRPGTDGAIYSIHAPGIAVTVLPAFALAGYRGAQGTVILLATTTGALIWWLGWVATRDRIAAWFAWAALVGAATFLIQGVTIFPDGPGALVVAVTLAALWRFQHRSEWSTGLLVVVSSLLAALPWMHSRFAVIACGMGALVLVQIFASHGVPAATRWRQVVVFLAVPAVSAAAWLGFFMVIYGTPNPSAPYGSELDATFGYVPGGLAGLLVDQQFGLLTYTPALLAVAIARRRIAGSSWIAFWGPVVVAVAYLAASAMYWMWWVGVPAPPARLAAAVLPALAAPIATAYVSAKPPGRVVLLSLLAVSLTISGVILGVERGALAWNTRDGHAALFTWLAPTVDVFRGWPSFFWALIPGEVRSEMTFFRHLLAWGLVAAMMGLVVWRLGASSERGRSFAGLVLPLGLMVAIQCGWLVTGSTGLAPAASQLQLLGRADPVVRIAPGTIGRVPRRDLDPAVRVFDRRQRSTDALPVLTEVPAGEYALDVALRRPQAGRVDVTLGRERHRLTTLQLEGRSRQSVSFALPAGAERLALVFDAPLLAVVDTITLRPKLSASGDAPLARAVLDLDGARFFFLDENVFVESDGFWVRGARHADAMFVAGESGGGYLVLTNGSIANDVTVRIDETTYAFALDAGEVRRVSLAARPGDPLPISIVSTRGFRPSDDGRSLDRRNLGVRVGFEWSAEALAAEPHSLPDHES